MPNKNRFLMIADHLALDLVNTVMIEEGEQIDRLRTDSDVLMWLKQADLNTEIAGSLAPGMLLAVARSLREVILDSIRVRKKNRPIKVKALNTFLASSRKYSRLIEPRGQQPFSIQVVYQAHDEMELLGPVADAAAELFLYTDFDLVRQCEHDNCILWFLDKTRAHRRRWCSMAICGNRQKVEAFRQRAKVEEAS